MGYGVLNLYFIKQHFKEIEIMSPKTIEHLENECKRFLDRLAEVKKIETKAVAARNTERAYYVPTATRKHGAMRRAAHDLKEALTLVTQNKDLS